LELIKNLLGIAWDMWQNWNEASHKTNDNRPRILEAEINQKVAELYVLRPSAFVSSNTLLKHPLPDLLQLPHAYKRHWVDMAIIAKAQQDRRKATPNQNECRAIQIWLTTFNPATN